MSQGRVATSAIFSHTSVCPVKHHARKDGACFSRTMLRPWNVNMQHSSGFSQRILWFVILEQGYRVSWHPKKCRNGRSSFMICSLWINILYVILYTTYIYIYITYIYIYPVGEGKVCKRNGTSYWRLIVCGAVWVPVPETFSIYSLFLPASLCLVHKEYSNFLWSIESRVQSLGILAHLLRMVSWNLHTMRFGGNWTPGSSAENIWQLMGREW